MDRRLPPGLVFEKAPAVVKWFNTEKGYGFVTPKDSERDALLHASVLIKTGLQGLPEKASVVCDIAEGRKGWQVTEIHEVDLESAPSPAEETDSASLQVGSVKFYNSAKGFGFVTPDVGGRDVFISIRTLERSGLMSLETDQRVKLTVRDSPKGPQATSVELV